MTKRIVIVLLAFVLVIALLPAAAFASEEAPEIPGDGTAYGETSAGDEAKADEAETPETCIGDAAYTETGSHGHEPAQSGVIESFSGDPIIHITETGLWSDQEWSVLKLTNTQRLGNGLRPLSTFKTLQQAARKRSGEIVTKFDHDRPDGSSCFTVLSEYGITYGYAGENIAAGYSTPALAVNGWMNSPGHKANILYGDFVHMGAGYTYSSGGSPQYYHHWVQLFTGGCGVTKLEVGSLSANPVLRPGNTIEDLNLIAVLTCSHGKSYIPLAAKMCTGYDKDSLREQAVTVKYGSLTTTISLQLEPRVKYEGNGADSGSPPTDYTNYKSGASVTVKGGGTLVKDGFVLSGWTTAPDGSGAFYKPGDKFTIGSADVTLYAMWEKVIVITTQPTASITVAEWQIAPAHRLVVLAELDGSSAGLNYQWYSSLTPSNKTGAKIAGETSADFFIPVDLIEGAYYYFCEISATDARSIRSDVSAVTVTPPTAPVITISAQPVDVKVNEGSISGSLSVTAYATQGAALNYEWYECDSGGAPTTGISSGAGSVFAIPDTLTAGVLYYYCEVSAPGAGLLRSRVTAVNIEPPAAAISLLVSPTHAVLASSGDEALFTAIFGGGAADIAGLVWEISPDANQGADFTFTDNGDGTATVKLIDPYASEAVLTIKAAYQGKYISAATVEIAPGGVSAGITAVKLLETRATINIAKENPFVRVPVLVSNRPEVLSSLASSEPAISALAEPPPLDFAPLVELEVNKAKAGQPADWQPLEGFSATMSRIDSRYIEIKALPDPVTGKYPSTAKNARVTVDGVTAGSINLVITETYPKITVKAGQLNMFYPDRTTGFSATANDGTRVTVLAIDYFAVKDAAIAEKQPGDPLALKPLKTGTANFRVTLKLDGYNRAAKSGDIVKAGVKVINAAPKLKLSSPTMVLAGNQPFSLKLLPNQKNVTLEALGAIRSVKLDDIDVNRYQGNGSIVLPGNITAGIHALKVDFTGGANTVNLKLTVKRIDPSKVTAGSATKTVVVNTNHNNGDIITININPSASNLVISDWAQTNTKVAMPNGIAYAPGANSITFSVTDKTLLSPTAKAVALEFNSGSSPLAKPLKISLSVTGKEASFRVSQKGKIDIANPASEVTASVTLLNTTSAIADVKLYDQAFDANKKFIDPVAAGAGLSTKFEVGAINGNTFTIKAKNGTLVPGAAKKLSLFIVLGNGDVITSWVTSAGGLVKDTKAITIKPAQTVFKAKQDKKAVTLYKLAPQVGERIDLEFSTAAGARLGDVEINMASVSRNDYFELARGGKNTWELKLKDGFDPYLLNGKGKSVYKAGYTVKLELWAEGTYEMSGGRAIPRVDGKFKTKPTIVSIRVYLK